MATLQDFIDDLNDRLNDEGDSQAPYTTKVRYLNYGISAMWPRLYITARDTSLVYADGTADYAIPEVVGANSKILRVEIESGPGSAFFNELHDFDVIPGLTDPILSLQSLGRYRDGALIRITAAKIIPALVEPEDVYLGPIGSEELPILYAMGIALSRRLDDRLDHRRYSTTQGVNQVDTADVMEASQFWFAQFELLLDRMALPLPAPTA